MERSSSGQAILSPQWPEQGRITLSHMSLVFPGAQAPFFTDVSCELGPQQRVAVIGKTGSGKSTLLTTFTGLNTVTPPSSVAIDGVSLEEVGLQELRRRVCCMPQTSVVFKDTVRRNLDFLERYPEAMLWEALEAVRLGSRIRALHEQLDTVIDESLLSEGGKSEWTVEV